SNTVLSEWLVCANSVETERIVFVGCGFHGFRGETRDRKAPPTYAARRQPHGNKIFARRANSTRLQYGWAPPRASSNSLNSRSPGCLRKCFEPSAKRRPTQGSSKATRFLT